MSITLDLSRVSNAPAVKAPVNLSGLTRAGLRQALIDAGVCPPEKAKMRASQVWSWIHHYGVTDFAAMSNVAKDMQAKLAEHFTLARPEIVERQVSKDGTRKWLIRTAPGIEIETVYIPDVGRAGALCVSSQVGCTLNCTFCHTGTQKLVRNLTAAEIVAQVQVARDDLEEWPSPKEDRRLSNIVFMGMGEPLMNYNNVLKAIEMITSPEGLGMSPRRITVSTSGVPKMIKKMADEEVKFRLAVSLHSAIDEVRTSIMPFNATFPLKDLREALEYWYSKTKNRITYEYVVWKGINDTREAVDALVKFCKFAPSKVNLIEYNPIDDDEFQQASMDAVEMYQSILESNGITVTIRRSRGKDIDAACGQLANKS